MELGNITIAIGIVILIAIGMWLVYFAYFFAAGAIIGAFIGLAIAIPVTFIGTSPWWRAPGAPPDWWIATLILTPMLIGGAYGGIRLIREAIEDEFGSDETESGLPSDGDDRSSRPLADQ